MGINILTHFFNPLLTQNLSDINLNKPIKNKLLLYGVDFMNNDRIITHFSEGNIKIISNKRINQSNCIIELEN